MSISYIASALLSVGCYYSILSVINGVSLLRMNSVPSEQLKWSRGWSQDWVRDNCKAVAH